MANPTIGIISALTKEFAAMKALLEASSEFDAPGRGAGHRYVIGEIPAKDGGKHVVALCFAGMGNTSAATRATLLLGDFPNLDLLIMVGIAGGVPNPTKAEEHVRLGDIVVSDKGGVVQYDFGKEVTTSTGDETTVLMEHKSPPRPPSALLLETVGLLEAAEISGERPWISHISEALTRLNITRPQPETDILHSTTDRRVVIDHPPDPSRIDGQPRLFTGTIASANIVLKNPVKRDYLREKFSVKAVEMEGFGIADAAWNAGAGYLVVRGICDYCDSNKGDDWQMYAAIVAAGYVRALIESMPSPRTRTGNASEGIQDIVPRLNQDQYLHAVKTFSETNAYFALGNLLADEEESQADSYVPLLLQPKDPRAQDEKGPRVLSAVLQDKSDAPYLLFVGAGGAGKSTLLRQIARLAWTAPSSIGLEQPYLPMIIRLSAFAATKGIVVEKQLRDAMHKAGELSVLQDLPDGFFSDWPLQSGAPWILLFDGLDEVPQDQRLTLIAQLLTLLETIKADGHRVAITSRPDEFTKQLASKFKAYNVLGFTSRQQREFANHRFGNNAEEFLSEVRSLEAAEISSSPLLLTIAAVVFRRDGHLLKNKVSLYHRFVQIWLDEAGNRGLKNELGDELFELVPIGLEHLALKMTEQPGEGSVVALSRTVAAYLSSVLGVSMPKALALGKKFVETLGLRSGVFIKNGDVCDWAHPTIREYMAARALETQLVVRPDDYATVLGERPFDSDWREIVIILTQLHENPGGLLQWLAAQAKAKDNADSSLLVYDCWVHSNIQNDPELCKTIVDLLVTRLGDWRARSYDREMLKTALVDMSGLAVPALLDVLQQLNPLQGQLVPDWNERKPPDIHTERGDRIYKGFKQRRGIIEVFGQIKDTRTLEQLVAYLNDDKEDSYRREIREAARKALKCIGADSVAPLLAVIRDSNRATEERHQALVALKLVGVRTEAVSEGLDECLREGLSATRELIRWGLFAATGLRDSKQLKYAHEALRLDDQELAGEAAEFFSSLPDRSAFAALADALRRWRQLNPHPFSSDFALKRLLAALLATDNPSAHVLSRSIVSSSLRRAGLLRPHEALQVAGTLQINGARKLVLTELLWQLKRPDPKFRIANAFEVLSNTWRPDQLTELVKTTHRIEAAVGEAGLRSLVAMFLQASDDNSLSGFADDSAFLQTLAKCQIHNFSEHAGQLLGRSDRSFQQEVSDALWIAGDIKAEESLIARLKQAELENANAEDRHWDVYHVLRALGTCGSTAGAEVVLDYVLRNPRLNIELSQEVLWPLLKRGVLDPDLLVSLAENRATHEFARNFFVEALGVFDAPGFSSLFCGMLANDSEQVKANAAYFLGWSKDPRAAGLLRSLLAVTQSAFVAERAARSLVKLKGTEALDDIVGAIERFEPGHREGLIREAARIKDSSIVKYLKNTTRTNEWSPMDRGHLLNAIGEFYAEPWARTIMEEWLEDAPGRFDTGQQSLAFRILAKHDPGRLVEQAVRLYDQNGLEASAKIEILDLLRPLALSERTNRALLSPLLKRLLCDQDLAIRESAAQNLAYLDASQSLQIYEELKAMGNNWAEACAVYSLGFWDSDESQIESMRFSGIHVVRYFADRALGMRQNRPHLRQLADMFIATKGVARVSCYLALAEQADEQILYYIDERLENDCVESLFLTTLQSQIRAREKKRRHEMENKERELFCNSLRHVSAALGDALRTKLPKPDKLASGSPLKPAPKPEDQYSLPPRIMYGDPGERRRQEQADLRKREELIAREERLLKEQRQRHPIIDDVVEDILRPQRPAATRAAGPAPSASHSEWFWGGTAVLITILALVFWGLLFVAAWGFYFIWIYRAPWFLSATKRQRRVFKCLIDAVIALGLFVVWLYVPSPFKGQTSKPDDSSMIIHATPTPNASMLPSSLVTPIAQPQTRPAPVVIQGSNNPAPSQTVTQTSTASLTPSQPTEQPDYPTAKIMWSGESVPSLDENFPFGLRVVIQTNVAISPTHLRVVFSGPIGSGRGSTAGTGSITNVRHGFKGNVFDFYFGSPAFSPDLPVAVTVYSATRIKVVSVALIP